MRRRRNRRRLNLRVRGLRPPEANVFARRHGKDYRVLRHHGDCTSKIIPRHIAQVHAVQPHHAGLRIVKPHDQLQDRRLPRPRWPHQSHGFTGVDGQTNTVQRRYSRPCRVVEPHLLKLDRAFHRACQHGRHHRIAHRIRGAQQFHQPLRRPRRPLQFTPYFRQRANRPRHHHRIDQKLHQFAGCHRARPHIARADPQNADNPAERQENDDHGQHRPRPDPGARRLVGLFRHLGKRRLGALLVRERLHGLHR